MKETLVLTETTHWMKYSSKLLLSLLLGSSGLVLLFVAWVAQDFPSLSLPLFLIGFLLNFIAHHRFFHLLFSEELFDILVTSERVIYFDDCIFFCDDEHEVPLHKISGVESRQRGLLPNLLNYGTLWFDTGGGMMDLKRSIPFVSKPDRVAERIADILREHPSTDPQ